VKKAARRRSILHIDLDPFIVSVERSFDPKLRGVPVIVGAGVVAAASPEARAAGVRTGQSILHAQRLCPAAVVKPGDLETYGRISNEVTTVLLSVSRRVERPSADEAYVDLTPERADTPLPVTAAEHVKDELQRRLRLDVSLGLASSRLAARVASRGARPRGLLVVLPGYEERFLAGQPVSVLDDLPPHLEAALEEAGLRTLGDIAEADAHFLASVTGVTAALRLVDAVRCESEEPIAVAAPPVWIAEEAQRRDARTDAAGVLEMIGGLARRAARRLRPFDLAAGVVTVEVRRRDRTTRRSHGPGPGLWEDEVLERACRDLAQPLIDPAVGVRSVEVRLTRLTRRPAETPFPGWSDVPRQRAL
jgi:DNA polymerase-4